jgi:hypothetical protein
MVIRLRPNLRNWRRKMYRPLLVTLIALASLDAQAALITNGSFDTTTPAVAAGSFVLFTPGSSGLTGWTVVGAAGTDIGAVSTTYTQSGLSFVAQDGPNWLDLTGFNSNNTTEGVQQTVATTVGNSYTLSFFVGNLYSPGTGFGVTSSVKVSGNGAALGTFTNSCTTCTTTQGWQMFNATFTATSASTTLQFLNNDPANDNTNGLDNVLLVDNGPAVPLPSSIGLLGSALFGLVGWRRKVTA